MLIFAGVTLYPFWYVLIYALNETQDAYSGGLWFWPRKFTLENIGYMLQRIPASSEPTCSPLPGRSWGRSSTSS